MAKNGGRQDLPPPIGIPGNGLLDDQLAVIQLVAVGKDGALQRPVIEDDGQLNGLTLAGDGTQFAARNGDGAHPGLDHQINLGFGEEFHSGGGNGDAEGIVEYTIDAIKYIDGTEIKDVIIDGNKTVMAGVKIQNQVSANISKGSMG